MTFHVRNWQRAACSLALLCSNTDGLAQTTPTAHVVVVIGAPGTEEYGRSFRTWATRLERAAERGVATFTLIDGALDAERDPTVHRERLQETLSRLVTSEPNDTPLWLVLIGHGTFDGRQTKFNLRGPDVTSLEVAAWLEPLTRPIALVACCSSSGPFVNHVSKQGRVVVTACKSGEQSNYSRFGEYFTSAFDTESSDLDRDGQVSLLEAFLFASQEVAAFFEREARLATEHALLDDDGNGLGTSAALFRGVHAIVPARAASLREGVRAHHWVLVPSERERSWPPTDRARRDELEVQLERLRSQRDTMEEGAYLDAIEPVLVELARLHATVKAGD